MLLRDQDAYGKMIWDRHQGKTVAEICERDDGWIAITTGDLAYFTTFKQWPVHQRKALCYVRGRVLDVGAGAGRWSLELQKRGHKVLAIDDSPLAIRTCKARGVKQARVLSFDRIAPALGTFDTILMMGNNFGLFGSPARAKRLLRHLHKMTSSQARIVAETNDVYQTKDPDHLAYQRRNRRRGRMAGQLRIRVRYRKCVTPWFDYLMVSKKELEEIVDGTGWYVERFIDGKHSSFVAVLSKEVEPC
jgi:SAM-dependent methyltransferase